MHRKLPDPPSEQQSQTGRAKPRNAKCAKCGVSFEVAETRLLPFCSVRCQQIDLAAWLDEDYGLPFEGDTTGQIVEYVDPAQDEDD